MSKNTRFLFKVIEFDTNRTGIYDILLVTNGNRGYVAHFPSYGGVNVENRLSDTSLIGGVDSVT